MWCAVAFVWAVAVGCGKDEAVAPAGPSGKETLLLSIDRGQRSVRIAAAGAWTAAISPASGWIRIEGPDSGRGDGRLTLGYDANGAFPRAATLVVASGAMRDTILLKQYGKTPTLAFPVDSVRIAPTEGRIERRFSTNLPPSLAAKVRFAAERRAGEAADWIGACRIEDDMKTISFRVEGHRSAASRQATLRASFTDDWGRTYTASCTVTQAAVGGTDRTRVIGFDELKRMIPDAAGTLRIEEDLALEGIVASDCRSANTAANPSVTAIRIDYTENARTIYLQRADASAGLRIRTVSGEVNTLRRGDRLRLWLKGLTLRKEADPERYALSEADYVHLLEIADGDPAALVRKERSIGELTDADLYTFVTLGRCEIPVREGGYTPINEGYGAVYGAGRIDCYPRLIRDHRGDALFLMTNLGCDFRRDGTELPAGAGTIAGVVVHEPYARFEKDGKIGRYQIRPLFREDISLSRNPEDGFSHLVAEWSVPRIADGVVVPNAGAGSIVHTSGKAVYPSADYSLPGPITGRIATDNKGAVSGGGFSCASWWNAATDSGESWVIGFSTRRIPAGRLSLQVATVNLSVGAPRYWAVEWSDRGDKMDAWTRVGEYTVPDIAQWSNTLLSQLPAHKNIQIDLPADLLGRETVYVRLRAARNRAGTETSYDGGTVREGAANTLSYVSIRYDDPYQ